MKKIFLSLLLIIIALCAYSQRVGVDTIYYDKEWKSVSHKAFATYYRVIEINDRKYAKSLRDFYVTGEVRGERNYISIDYNDDSNSIFDGESYTYYKNGLVKNHSYLKEGKLDGICSTFTEDGDVCVQVEYNNGNPIHDSAVVTTRGGCVSRIRLSDNSPIWRMPDEKEKKIEYKNGEAWSYYYNDGLLLKMKVNQIKDYGKWYKLSVVFVNNSIYSIDFNPANIKAFLKKKDDKYELEVCSAEKYIEIVKDKQTLKMLFAGLAEGLAAANAGYSTSTTYTNRTYSANYVINGNAYAYVPGAYAYANYNENGYLNGNSNTTSTTTSYNGAAEYQARVIASNRMADYANDMEQEREYKEMGYLKRNTIHPGEAISGYVNVFFRKGSELQVMMKINDVRYKFVWDVDKKHN